MSITYKRHINSDEKGRVEFLLINFDYVDGNDYLSSFFRDKFGMNIGKKVDGIFFSEIRLHAPGIDYILVWHEDVGNYLYSVQQDKNSVDELERRLNLILSLINP